MKSATGKGKAAVRGQKQIYEENTATMRFYVIMAGCALAMHLMALLGFFEPITKDWVLLGINVSAQLCALLLMRYMAKATFNGAQLVDAGLDLNMEQGVAEYCKDAMILTSTVHFLTIFTRYFWLVLLLIPGTALFKLWSGIIYPWMFAPAAADQDNEEDERKRKKKDRVKYKRI